jgi:hypothetical protein
MPASGDPRRARSAVLAALAGFALLQGGLLAAVEAWPRLRDPMYGDKAARMQRRFAAAEPGAAKVVLLGTSRTGYGFDAKRCEAVLRDELGRPAVCFNFGIPSSGPVTHNLYLKRLLAEGVRPDLLLLEVLPPLLADCGPQPREACFMNVDRLLGPGELYAALGYGCLNMNAIEGRRETAWVPWYELRFALLGRVVPSWNHWGLRHDWSRCADEAGWSEPEPSVSKERWALGTVHAWGEYGALLQHFRPGGPAAAALRDSLATCSQAGIPVALVLMPEATIFRAFYGPGSDERLLVFLSVLRQEFGVPVIDARPWVDDGDFRDTHHLLLPGAKVFTERLAREVAPLLRAGKGGPS